MDCFRYFLITLGLFNLSLEYYKNNLSLGHIKKIYTVIKFYYIKIM